jgi:hypothetical protein
LKANSIVLDNKLRLILWCDVSGGRQRIHKTSCFVLAIGGILSNKAQLVYPVRRTIIRLEAAWKKSTTSGKSESDTLNAVATCTKALTDML